MIVEHMTIYNVLLGIFAIVLIFVRTRKFYIQYVSYALGAITGAAVMFSNSAYGLITDNADAYRSIASGSLNDLIGRMMNNYVNEIYNNAFKDNICLNIVLLLLCWMIFRALKNKENTFMLHLRRVCLAIMALYILFSFVRFDYDEEAGIFIQAMAAVPAVIAMMVFILTAAKETGDLIEVSFTAASVVCIILPLFVVTPIGGRCFVPSYIFFVLLTNELAGMLLKLKPDYEKYLGSSKKILLGMSLLCFAFYIFVCTGNYRAEKERAEYIREKAALGETEIELLHCPYETYLWRATPERIETENLRRYKLFYGIPEEITLIPVYEYTE